MIWWFVEDLFTYQKTPFENFCDLRFSHKWRKFENFFDGPLRVSWLGQEVKNDMSGQSKGALGVCNVKIRKSLTGAKLGTSSWLFALAAPSAEQFELFFLKMVKLEEKESPDPKLSDLSDLVKFSKLSCLTCLCGSITFSSFLTLILVRFWCMTMQIEAYDLLYKNMKKIADVGTFLPF